MFRMYRKLALILIALLFFSNLMVPFGMANAHKMTLKETKTVGLEKKPYVQGEVIVKFRPEASSKEISSAKAELSLKSKHRSLLTGTELMTIKNGESIESVLSSLKRNKAVEYAQPNYRYYAQSVPNDVYFSELWGLNNSSQPNLDIDALQAWQITKGPVGSAELIVAVLDTGVDINHPDLNGRIWSNPGESGLNANDGEDDDNNGYIDDTYGWDFSRITSFDEGEGDNTVFDPLVGEDEDQHGTHVAGTIAAAIDNTIGITGVAPKVKIMPLKIIDNSGYVNSFGAILAIGYAAEKGAKVINASWGGLIGLGEDQALLNAINEAGIVFVAAAGNSALNTDAPGNTFSPAGLNSSKIISVAAVDNTGTLASFSNYGSATVDVAAPGVGIKSLKPTYPQVAAAVYRDGGNYKAIHFGFGLEHIADDTTRAQVLQKALAAVGASITSDILVVDDDNSEESLDDYPDYRPDYTEALSVYQNVYYKTAGDSTAGPTLAEMQGKTVIWFTGQAFGVEEPSIIPTLKDQDRQNLRDFLAQGGKLILTGDDLAYQSEDDPLFTTYLKEEFLGEDKWRDNSIGSEETAFAGIDAQLSGFISYKDALLPLDGAQAIFSYPQVGNGNEYQDMQGTSMATPHVSGIAALILSINPSLTPEQVISIIKNTVTTLPTLQGKTVTGGMVNAYKAVLEAAAPTGVVATKADQQVTLSWNNSTTWNVVGYNVYNCSSDGSIYSKITTVTQATYAHLGLTNGQKYYYKVNAFDALGNVSQFSSLVNATPGTSSGGGGGGGGGGGAPATPVPVLTKPSTDDISGTADIKTTISGDGTKIITAEVSANKLDQILAANPTNKDFFITIEGTATKKEISLPVSSFTKLAEKDVKLSIKTEGVTLNIPMGGIKAAGADIKISLQELASSVEKPLREAAWKQQELSQLGKIMEFTIEAVADGKKTEIKSFGGQVVTGELNFISSQVQGINDLRKLGVYKYQETTGKWQYVPSKVVNSKVIFTTSTFSKYSIMSYDKTFKDISSHWAKNDIEIMAAKQVVQGVNTDQFAPEAKITRAQFAALLVRALNLNDSANKGTFKDVTANAWYYPYVEAASQAGIIKGAGDSKFLPEKQISREEMAVMMVRATKLAGQEANINSTEQNNLLSKFKDQSKINSWAKKEVASAVKLGIFNGAREDSFIPAQAATRAQSAVVIKRLMEKAGLI